MQLDVIKNDKLDYHLRITIPANDINQAIEEELHSLTTKVKIDGFRPGKTPISILKKKYGESVRLDVIKLNIEKGVRRAIEDLKLEIASTPEVSDIKDLLDADLEFIVKVESMPKFELPDFKTIEIEKPVIAVVGSQVDTQLQKLREATIDYHEESVAAEIGDKVVIDAIGYQNGEKFEGGEVKNHGLVLGSNQFVPGFEGQLVGAKSGDTVNVNITFPEDYFAKTLAGKPAEFVVNILSVQRGTLSKIDEAFCQKFNTKNEEELRNLIANTIKQKLDSSVYLVMKTRLFNQLDQICDFDIPSSMFDAEHHNIHKSLDKIKHEDEEMGAKSPEELEGYCHKLTSRRVKIGMVLSKYIKSEDLSLTEQEGNRALLEHMKQFPGYESEILKFFQKNPQSTKPILSSALEDKAVEQILSSRVAVKEKLCTVDELENLLEKETELV